MPTGTLARSLFDKLLTGDCLANIQALVNSTPLTTEDDWLDVKGEHPDVKQRDKKSKEIWSEVLGGFANNQGGVVIWGLDARKKEVEGRMIDAITSEVPVADPEALRAKLTDWRRQATDPPLPNVEIVAVPFPDESKKGFVICYIPEGAHKPYRSEDANRNYYLRAGDNTVVMSRSVLSSMFYPKSKASFLVQAKLSWASGDARLPGGEFTGNFTLQANLTNVGTATAKDVTVRIAYDLKSPWKPPLTRLEFAAHGGWLRSSDSPDGAIWIRGTSIHPHQSLSMFWMRWAIPEGPGTDYRVIPRCPEPEITFSVFCENQEHQIFRPQFSLDELVNKRVADWSGGAEESS